jgi:hypothetical protein
MSSSRASILVPTLGNGIRRSHLTALRLSHIDLGELSRRSQMPVVSSDAVRKRLAHLVPSQPARQEHYNASFTRATYEQLTHDALLALQRQGGLIVDASCWPWSAPRGVWAARGECPTPPRRSPTSSFVASRSSTSIPRARF